MPLFSAVGAFAADLTIKVTSLPTKFVSNGIDSTPTNNSVNNVPASLIYNGNVYISIGSASKLTSQPFTYDGQKVQYLLVKANRMQDI